MGRKFESVALSSDPALEMGPAESQQVIGLSGRTGSGKTLVAQILSDCSYAVRTTRSVLEQVLRDRGQDVSRTALRQLGAEIHYGPGQEWLFERVTRGVGAHGYFVVDALRFPDDHAYLLKRFGSSFLHLHIDASDDTRRRRFIDRGGTLEEFVAAQPHVTEAEATAMRHLAHLVITNDSSADSLKTSVVDAVCAHQPGAPACL